MMFSTSVVLMDFYPLHPLQHNPKAFARETYTPTNPAKDEGEQPQGADAIPGTDPSWPGAFFGLEAQGDGGGRRGVAQA